MPESIDEADRIVDQLVEMLQAETRPQALVKLLEEAHPADIADALDELPDDAKKRILQHLDPEIAGEVLHEADEEHVREYLEEAPVETIVTLIDDMYADDAADFLEQAEPEKAEQIIAQLSPETAEEVRELRSYEPDTAGGIMTVEYFHVTPDERVADILLRLKDEEEEMETVREIFVCTAEAKLKGIVTVEDLIKADPIQTAAQIMDKATITVGPNADQEICARYMKKYDMDVLAVIDMRRRMLGIITVDDILEVMSDEASEDMYRLAGVGDSKPLEHGAWIRAWKRLPWLAVTLIGCSLLGMIIQAFEVTMQKVVALTFFIPAIMGIGGNAGIQASTITVRGLGMGEIDFDDLWHLLGRELKVGLLIAVFCSVTIALVSYGMVSLDPPHPLPAPSVEGAATQEDTRANTNETAHVLGPRHAPHEKMISIARFALTVGMAMFFGVLSAVLLGTCVPMVCFRLGVDPAVVSGPFITTLVDIGTQTIYLGLATWLLLW